LTVGDSLSGSIDRGLAESQFGIVIISKAFLGKPWPEREYRGLVAKEMAGERKVILPVWHGATHSDIASVHPPLADLLATNSARGIGSVADDLIGAMHPNGRFAGPVPNSTVHDAAAPSGAAEEVRIELIALLRASDMIGVRELLRHERQHFERGVMLTLAEASRGMGPTVDFERLKPVEADLWVAAERRLAALLVLLDYHHESASVELRSLATFAAQIVPTASPYSAWQQGHRVVVWWICWVAGATSLARENLAAARLLWKTMQTDEAEPLPAMRQLGGAELEAALARARVGKALPLDGLWHMAFNAARSDLFRSHYPEVLGGIGQDGPLTFLGFAGDWAILMSILARREKSGVAVPKYWHASQVQSNFFGRLERDQHLAAQFASELLDGSDGASVSREARVWAESAPGPSQYL
jgi:hypothetical protein